MAIDEFIDFEDGQLPPAGSTRVTSADGSGTEVSIVAAAARSGTRGRRCVDDSTTAANPQRGGLAHTFPPGRFEWRAQAWFNPIGLGLSVGHAVYLLCFPCGTSLSVAARIRNDGGTLRAGLVAKNPDDTFVSDDAAVITAGRWRRRRLDSSGWRHARRPRTCISTKADA
jgi:hypothetical protein